MNVPFRRAKKGVCAECGKAIERQRDDRWASRLDNGFTGWDYCCRVAIEWNEEGTSAKITQADYHHIAGEEQRHFPK